MRRSLWVLVIVLLGTSDLSGQVRGNHKVKYYMEMGFMSGMIDQNFKTIPLTSNYLNPVNTTEGKLKYTNIAAPGYNIMFGRYFDKKTRFGIQAGLIYTIQRGYLGIDTFHVEYQSKDYNGNTFRQSVTANDGISETITTSNVSIPVVFKFRQKLTDVISLTVDAGIVYNVLMRSTYKTDASFDYEAIYQMEGTGTKLTYHYDNSSQPGPEDWLITRNEFLKDNPKGNIKDYFDNLKYIGFNVGLNKPVTQKTGTIDYKNKNIGYIGQIGLNFQLSKLTLLKFGAYYVSQTFSNPTKTKYLVPTSKPGAYTSMMSFTQDLTTVNYGVTVGLVFHFLSYTNFGYDKTFNQAKKEQ